MVVVVASPRLEMAQLLSLVSTHMTEQRLADGVLALVNANAIDEESATFVKGTGN